MAFLCDLGLVWRHFKKSASLGIDVCEPILVLRGTLMLVQDLNIRTLKGTELCYFTVDRIQCVFEKLREETVLFVMSLS